MKSCGMLVAAGNLKEGAFIKQVPDKGDAGRFPVWTVSTVDLYTLFKGELNQPWTEDVLSPANQLRML